MDRPSQSGEHDQTGFAIMLLLAAILCFDAMAVLVRVLSAHYTVLELSAYRNVFGVIPSLALMLWTGELRFRGSNLRITRWKVAISRGVVVALAQVFFYTAIARLELATVSALSQTNAFFVVILAIVILREHVGVWRWAAIAIGFVGAVWILRPGTDAFSIYALFPIGAALCYAYSMVTVRLFGPEVSSALLYLYTAVTAAIAAILLAMFTTSFSPIVSWVDVVLILAMAIVGGIAVLLLTLSYRLAQPSILATFGYFGILTAFLWGWLFFGEAPLETLFPGVVLIVGAGVLIIWRENRARKMG